MSETERPDALRIWSDAAPYWAKHRDVITAMFEPVTPVLVDEARIAAGHAVLDVAGGTGEPSLAIARVVGRSGRVTCTDAVAAMAAAADREARRRGVENMAVAACTAEALPFDDDAFDAVVCRFGVMFFPEPEAGIGDMLRVARPGGSIAFAVWRARELNPLSQIIADTLSRFVELPPSGADAFRFGEAGVLGRLLVVCGAEDVRERVVDFRHRLPIGFDEFWSMRIEMSESLRAALERLTDDEARLLAEQVREATAEYFPEGRMDFPASALVVSGRK